MVFDVGSTPWPVAPSSLKHALIFGDRVLYVLVVPVEP
jgi:hypothetical protein